MALNSQGVRRLIFDLDDTLLDTEGQLVEPASREACTAMIEAGLTANLDECLDMRKAILRSGKRGDLYMELTHHLGVKPDVDPLYVAQAGFTAFHNREVKEPITLVSDAAETLAFLGERYELYLITLGSLDTQREKVRRLALEDAFEKIFHVDISVEKTKTRAMKEILTAPEKLLASQHVCIGNRIDSEIRDGKGLGMQTILISHGEHRHLKAQDPAEEPDHLILRLTELRDIFI